MAASLACSEGKLSSCGRFVGHASLYYIYIVIHKIYLYIVNYCFKPYGGFMALLGGSGAGFMTGDELRERLLPDKSEHQIAQEKREAEALQEIRDRNAPKAYALAGIGTAVAAVGIAASSLLEPHPGDKLDIDATPPGAKTSAPVETSNNSVPPVIKVVPSWREKNPADRNENLTSDRDR
jgi:hypothetical protein